MTSDTTQYENTSTTEIDIIPEAVELQVEEPIALPEAPAPAPVQEAPRKYQKVLIAIPCYGGQIMDTTVNSLLRFTWEARDRGIQTDVYTIAGESLITRARNNAISMFVKGDWTDLLFIDGDIGFEPESAWRLLDSNHDVVATPYPLKKIDWETAALADSPEQAKQFAINTVVNYYKDSQVDENGFAPVLDAGTGFMKISRFAATALISALPGLQYLAEDDDEPRWALFDTMLYRGRYLSEDYAFCRRWQDLGGIVYADVSGPNLSHRGFYEYKEA